MASNAKPGWLRRLFGFGKKKPVPARPQPTAQSIPVREAESDREPEVSHSYLARHLNSIVQRIELEQVVYLVDSDEPHAFALGPLEICGAVCGLHGDPEYGWPYHMALEDNLDPKALIPGGRKHPFLTKGGRCVAVAVSINEYREILAASSAIRRSVDCDEPAYGDSGPCGGGNTVRPSAGAREDPNGISAADRVGSHGEPPIVLSGTKKRQPTLRDSLPAKAECQPDLDSRSAMLDEAPGSDKPSSLIATASCTLDGTSGVDGLVSSGPDAQQAELDSVPAEWNVGDVILGLYEVKQIHHGGAMGLVYRVHHRDWDQDVAVKCPLPNYFKSQAQKENFVRECLAWISLGLHPHIVTCHCVRTLGGIPRVFAEYVEGGGLEEWIRSRRLYEGGRQVALKRVMDIAVQFAWGLHFAHEKGLIHQDVKPANVLMTADGTAKVADFGLSNARAASGEGMEAEFGGSILASYGGMTPAYCSPEQANKEKLTRRTDIWSWAVSILEMFTGEVTWMAGQVADSALDGYLEAGTAAEEIPEMPRSLAELLKRCLRRHPDERPHDLGEVAQSLRETYRTETDEKLNRPDPKPVEGLADTLNNEGISLSELGLKQEAEKRFEASLKTAPHNLEATYNLGLLRWRSGRCLPEELLGQLQEASNACDDELLGEYLMGLVHVERGDSDGAVRCLEKSEASLGHGFNCRRALAAVCSIEGNWCKSVWASERNQGAHCVAISADGRWALTGGSDLRFWDLSTGKCLHELKGHMHPVNSVAITADGRRGVSGGSRETMLLWDLVKGRCLQNVGDYGSVAESVAISADGTWGLVRGNDQRLHLWDLRTVRCTQTYETHDWVTNATVISPFGTWALTGTDEGGLRLWELCTGECLRSFEGHIDRVTSVAISPDGRLALSGGVDGSLFLWELDTGRRLNSFKGLTDSINAVAISPDGRWGLSGSGSLRLWELDTSKCLRASQPHRVSAVAVSADGRHVVSCDGTLRMWKLATGPISDHVEARVRSVETMASDVRAFAADLNTASQRLSDGAVAEALKAVRSARSSPGMERSGPAMDLWERIGKRCQRSGLRGAWCLQTFEGHTDHVTSVAFSPNGHWALSGSKDRSLRLWDLLTMKCVRELQGHGDWVNEVAVSPDGCWGISGSQDETVRQWDLATGKCLRTFEGHRWGVGSVAISPDGRCILSSDGFPSDEMCFTAKTWQPYTGLCLRSVEGLASVSISPDGRWVLSRRYDDIEGLEMWELATGRSVRTFSSVTMGEGLGTISPDGKWLLWRKGDECDGLWDLATARCLRTLEGDALNVGPQAVTPDGRWVLSGGKEKSLRLSDLSTGKYRRTIDGHTNAVWSVAISPDGNRALSGSADNTIRLWELDWEYEFPGWADWDEDARPHLANFLTLHTPYAGTLPKGREPTEEEISQALTRKGKPSWTDDDFRQLLHILANAGYGWLRPEGVKRELEKMAADLDGPPQTTIGHVKQAE